MPFETGTQLESELNLENKSYVGFVERFWNRVRNFTKQHEFLVKSLFRILVAILYNCYFVAAIYYARQNGCEIDWCGGVGMLIILTILVYCGLFYYKIFIPFLGDMAYSTIIIPMSNFLDRCWRYR